MQAVSLKGESILQDCQTWPPDAGRPEDATPDARRAADQPEQAGQEGAGQPGEQVAECDSEDGAARDALKLALEQESARAGALQAQLVRLQADFDNYRRRTRADVDRLVDDAVERLARPLLGVVDDMERTMANIPADPRWSAVADGIRMVHQELLAALEAVGVRAVTATGEVFDPAYHQAAGSVDVGDPALEGRVVEEIHRGFVLTRTGRVLRPAVIRVGVLRAEGREPKTGEPQTEGIEHERKGE